MTPEQLQAAPFRRFGEWRDSDCDRWNAGEDSNPTEIMPTRPSEDAFGITHGATVEQAVGLAASLIQTTLEAEATVHRLEGVIEQKAIEEK